MRYIMGRNDKAMTQKLAIKNTRKYFCNSKLIELLLHVSSETYRYKFFLHRGDQL